MQPRILKAGIAVILGLAIVQAQTAQSASQNDFHDLQSLADQVKAALQKGDLQTAQRLSSDLMTGIFKRTKELEPTPQEKFATLEKALPLSGNLRFYALAQVAKAAFEANELDKADRYARELLVSARDYPKDWNYGNALFSGNTIIGRVALKRDHDVHMAVSSLVASAQTPGSPQLNSFGPSMSLAKDLLGAGERQAVLDFIMQCKTFWKLHPEKLDEWAASIKGGGTPDFRPNLAY